MLNYSTSRITCNICYSYVSFLGINDVLQEEQSDDAEILSPHGVFA